MNKSVIPFLIYTVMYLLMGAYSFSSALSYHPFDFLFYIAVAGYFVMPVPHAIIERFSVPDVIFSDPLLLYLGLVAIFLGALGFLGVNLLNKEEKRSLGVNIWKFLVLLSWATIFYNIGSILWSLDVLGNLGAVLLILISAISPLILTLKLDKIIKQSKNV